MGYDSTAGVCVGYLFSLTDLAALFCTDPDVEDPVYQWAGKDYETELEALQALCEGLDGSVDCGLVAEDCGLGEASEAIWVGLDVERDEKTAVSVGNVNTGPAIPWDELYRADLRLKELWQQLKERGLKPGPSYVIPTISRG